MSSYRKHYHQYYHFHKLNLESVGWHSHTIYLEGVGKHSHATEEHSHTIGDHTHHISKHRHRVYIAQDDGHSHAINANKLAHTHGLDHTHEIPLGGAGEHFHTFSVASHTHKVPIPTHRHGITPGIYESGNASSFDIYVNGTKKVSIGATSYNDDITQWLLNEQNMIPRNTWIDVEIRPNDLAYVVSTVFIQGFVQSRGGGNY